MTRRKRGRSRFRTWKRRPGATGDQRMSAAVGSKINIRRRNAPVGAEIVGVDLARQLDDATFGQIRNAYYEREPIRSA